MINWVFKSKTLQLGVRRSYWTATTFRSSSAINLVNAIEKVISSFKSPTPVLLFTISKNHPDELLSRLVTKFQSLVPSIEPIGVLTQDSIIGRFSVSIATWSGLPHDLVPFTSTVASRTPISVGREILPSSYHHSDISLRDDYEGEAHQINESPGSNLLPIELRNIPSNSIKSLIFFSAPSPQPFLKTLERNFPSAKLMGLIGSSTVFQTGRRSTLFRNKSITGEEGAVGIAVLDRTNVTSSTPLIRYPGMETLGSPMQVTKSKGNIILTLNFKKATSCLVEIIKKLNLVNSLPTSSDLILSKNKQFYLGFLNDQNQFTELNLITGGSISRATMSLDREKEIPINQFVQFIHFPEKLNTNEQIIISSQKEENKNNKVLMEFHCTLSIDDYLNTSQEINQINHQKVEEEEEKLGLVEKIDGLFLAFSEFGFIPKHQQIVNINHSNVFLELN